MNQATRVYYVLGNVAREVFKDNRDDKKKNDNNYYSDMIKLIPDYVSSILVEDNRKTVDFAVENRILIRPTC